MAVSTRIRASTKAGIDWNLWSDGTDTWATATIQLILLQEIREELKQLNRLLACRRFLDIPTRLKAIDRELKLARKAREVR